MIKNIKNQTTYLFLTALVFFAASTVSISAQTRVSPVRIISQPLITAKVVKPVPQTPQKILQVTVNPDYYSAKISISIRNPAKVRVEVGTRKPDSTEFNRRFVVSSQTIQARGSGQASVVSIPNLKSGVNYFYVIVVYKNDGAKETFYFGDFLTRKSYSY